MTPKLKKGVSPQGPAGNRQGAGRSPAFLDEADLRLLLFGGKGGVGKTTCAVAAALHYARRQPQGRFLLVSTDPAHSLRDSLAGLALPDNLQALEFDAQAHLSDFKKKHQAKLREIASRGTFLDDEDISRFMDLSLPGLDELMAFLEIARWAKEQKYRCIVVDTAPTGHTLRLLGMPELIGKWLAALDALLAKHRYMKRLFGGAYQKDELDLFLLDLSRSVGEMRNLLSDPVHCRFVPVLLAEALSLHETSLLIDELRRMQVSFCELVINRLYPENGCPQCSQRRARQVRDLNSGAAGLTPYTVSGVPLSSREPRGDENLPLFWETAFGISLPLPEPEISPQAASFKVENPPPLPGPDTRLLLFAGKGGVGKTTLACATAVRLATALNGKEILIFSTDPAHSLSACFDLPIGPQPTVLRPGLTAMEIDAPAEFETLKREYEQELAEFLNRISSNFDLTFDRDVMERVMDLSPPGIDEVMALTQVMDFLAQNRFNCFILDAAPTGHLLRLLETPDVIAQWLKVFFNLFLKYKHIFRLPRISERMVQISKALKQLQKLLHQAGSAALCSVAILTEMALLETKDLVAACRRMQIHVPFLFLNLAAPPGACPLCSAVYERETGVREKYAQLFPDQHQTIVYTRGEPKGLGQLAALGEALYGR